MFKIDNSWFENWKKRISKKGFPGKRRDRTRDYCSSEAETNKNWTEMFGPFKIDKMILQNIVR
jgi:hypothetical protein